MCEVCACVQEGSVIATMLSSGGGGSISLISFDLNDRYNPASPEQVQDCKCEAQHLHI